MEYRVIWEADVEAANPEAAARMARAMQTRPGSMATVFDVFAEFDDQGQGRGPWRVDLTEIEQGKPVSDVDAALGFSTEEQGTEGLRDQGPGKPAGKGKVWALAYDGDDCGTVAEIHLSERALYESLVEHVGVPDDGVAAMLKAGDFNGVAEWVDKTIEGSLDTYVIDEREIELPALRPEFGPKFEPEFGPAIALAAEPRVVVTLEGGLVTDVVADRPVRVAVIDYDPDGAEEEDLKYIPQSDGRTEAATAAARGVAVMPERVQELWLAITGSGGSTGPVATPAIASGQTDKTDTTNRAAPADVGRYAERLRKQAMDDWNLDDAPVAVDDDADVELEIDGGEVTGGWVTARVYVDVGELQGDALEEEDDEAH